jgi:hypothetical protein
MTLNFYNTTKRMNDKPADTNTLAAMFASLFIAALGERVYEECFDKINQDENEEQEEEHPAVPSQESLNCSVTRFDGDLSGRRNSSEV